ncbi:MAG: HAD family phosphatase [Verrucomicrobia bacterium]|nr:HAD family phosphatase [Verrucomicrobiota bacterium]
MIKTVYFDLGNVLVFFCHKRMIQQIAEVAGLTVPQVQALLIQERVQEQYERGQIKTEELYTRFSRLSNRSFSLLEFVNAASDIFTPNVEIFPVIHALKDQGIRLILLSNTSECHFNRVYSHYPILRQFDDHILSYEAKACKPDPLIFKKALSIAQCHKSECFYTDDIHEYVASARKSGLDSEVFTGVEPLRKHLSDRQIKIE